MASSNPIRWKTVRGTPVHVKSFIVALFLMPEFEVEDAAAQLDGLNAVGLIVPRSSRGQVAALNHQEKVEYIYINEQHSKPTFTHSGLKLSVQHR